MNIRTAVFCIASLCLLFLASCERPITTWEEAKRLDSLTGYAQYIRSSKSGSNELEARTQASRLVPDALRQAVALLDAKDSDAEEVLEDILAIHPKDPLALSYLGYIRYYEFYEMTSKRTDPNDLSKRESKKLREAADLLHSALKYSGFVEISLQVKGVARSGAAVYYAAPADDSEEKSSLLRGLLLEVLGNIHNVFGLPEETLSFARAVTQSSIEISGVLLDENLEVQENRRVWVVPGKFADNKKVEWTRSVSRGGKPTDIFADTDPDGKFTLSIPMDHVLLSGGKYRSLVFLISTTGNRKEWPLTFNEKSVGIKFLCKNLAGFVYTDLTSFVYDDEGTSVLVDVGALGENCEDD